MSILTKKLFRTIKSTRGQFIALVLIVTLGVSVYISMATSFYNLTRSQQVFYEQKDFADYFFHVVKAPEAVVSQIQAVPGITQVTGRIQKDISILKPDNQRAIGRLTSYPFPLERQLNQLELLTGRVFEANSPSGSIEVIVDPQYAQANKLSIGDNIEVLVEGKKRLFQIVGTATSPEFIYPMKDGASMFPEPATFGILMVPHKQAQQILNLQGQINQIVVKIAPGSDEQKIAEQIERILEPYGNIASYPRKDQLSNAVMQGEIDGLEISSKYLPAMFFAIAAGIQFILLNRLIKAQRLQIGVLKALGYSSLQVILHFTGYAISVAIVGVILGTLFGVGMASGISQMYAQFFNLPQTIGGVNVMAVFNSMLISIIVAALSGLTASATIVKINPAESMRPEAPKIGGKTLIETWSVLWNRLTTDWKMSMRSVSRNKVRFAVTALGIMSSVILLVLAFFTTDTVDYMMNREFKQVNRYDYIVYFSKPISMTAISYWNQWDDVERIEPILNVPVKIYYKEQSEDDSIIGIKEDAQLRQIFNNQGERMSIPDDGIILSQNTADKLGINVGDRIKIETKLGIGPSRINYLRVMGKHHQMFGSGSYVSLATANRLLEEKDVISSVMLKTSTGNNVGMENRLNDMTEVSTILSLQKEIDNIYKLMDSMLFFVGIMLIFAVGLGLAIVYNSSIMVFNERKRELASLRVIGYTQQEVRSLLYKETWVQAGAGIALGLPAGRKLGELYMNAMNTDLFSFPVIIYPQTYLISALIALTFVIAGQFFASRRIKKLDLIEVLKNRE